MPDRDRVILKANDRFYKMLDSVHVSGKGDAKIEQHYTIISFDPGETTGVAIYLPENNGFQIELMQLQTKSIKEAYSAISSITDNLKSRSPEKSEKAAKTIWVIEDYRVYSWKSDSHKWAGLHTPKLIGAIELMAIQQQFPTHDQMAIEAKQWATDENLKSWSLYSAGMKHARDASRHLITYVFFGKLPSPNK